MPANVPVPPKQRGRADVVFLLDVTGSMQPCIDGVKGHLGGFVEKLAVDEGQGAVDVRVRLFGFRDVVEGGAGKQIEEFPFVTSTEEFKKQLAAVAAAEGGDEPESTLDALYMAVKKSEWRERIHKIVVLMTDADMHPEMAESTVESGEARDMMQVKQILMTEKIFLFAACPPTENFKEFSNNLPDATFKFLDNAHDGLQHVDFKDLVDHIQASIRSSSFVMVKGDGS